MNQIYHNLTEVINLSYSIFTFSFRLAVPEHEGSRKGKFLPSCNFAKTITILSNITHYTNRSFFMQRLQWKLE